MPLRAQGATANFALDVRNVTGDSVDPTNLSLTFKTALGATVSGFPEVYPGDIVKDAVGHFHLDWAVPALFTLGTYTAQWDGILNGAPTQAFETWEIVPAGSMTTGVLDFLQAPEDYEAIRGLLGVTTLDVENSDIDRTAFAPQAELLVKRRIGNWLDQVAIPDQLYVLRLASIYQTACLMAESFVRGGTIGLVRPLSTGEGRDWAEAAVQFCSRSDYWINIADANDDTDSMESAYDVHPMRVGGPTSLRVRRARAGSASAASAWWNGYPPFWPE